MDNILCIIYVLLDPRTNQVRNVGKTMRSTETRLKEHIWEAKNSNKTYTSKWIRSLLKADIIPTIEIIDAVPEKDWKFWESHYIKLFKSFGARLTNLTGGGEGTTGYTYTDEARESARQSALRGYARGRKKLLGENHPMFGKTRSEETKKLISKANLGKICSKETKKKIRKGNLGKTQTEESRKLMSKARKGKTWEEIYGVEKANEMKESLSKKLSGKNNHNYGKIPSVKTRRLLSESHRGEKHYLFGKHLIPKTIKKMRKSALEVWKKRKEKPNKELVN